MSNWQAYFKLAGPLLVGRLINIYLVYLYIRDVFILQPYVAVNKLPLIVLFFGHLKSRELNFVCILLFFSEHVLRKLKVCNILSESIVNAVSFVVYQFHLTSRYC